MNEILEPLDIRLSEDGASLEVEWNDGHVSHTTLRALRWKCPCAICNGEAGHRGRLASLTELPPEEYLLTGVQPIGRYALAPVWKSGHDKGLYTYFYLRNLCDCPDHTAIREQVEMKRGMEV